MESHPDYIDHSRRAFDEVLFYIQIGKTDRAQQLLQINWAHLKKHTSETSLSRLEFLNLRLTIIDALNGFADEDVDLMGPEALKIAKARGFS